MSDKGLGRVETSRRGVTWRATERRAARGYFSGLAATSNWKRSWDGLWRSWWVSAAQKRT